MSTPIVDFDPNPTPARTFSRQNIGLGALWLYLAVSLPLLVLTLMAWYGVRKWEQRTERLEAAKRQTPDLEKGGTVI
jgi:hypothetical protein